MPSNDISKCTGYIGTKLMEHYLPNSVCFIRDKCLRFTLIGTEYQSYSMPESDFTPEKGCGAFLSNENWRPK